MTCPAYKRIVTEEFNQNVVIHGESGYELRLTRPDGLLAACVWFIPERYTCAAELRVALADWLKAHIDADRLARKEST